MQSLTFLHVRWLEASKERGSKVEFKATIAILKPVGQSVLTSGKAILSDSTMKILALGASETIVRSWERLEKKISRTKMCTYARTGDEYGQVMCMYKLVSSNGRKPLQISR